MADWTLHLGDALAVLATLDDGVADAILTDPPYSSGGMVLADRAGQSTRAKYVTTQNTRRDELLEFAGDNRDQRAFGYWCALWLGEALRVTRPGGIIMLFTDWRQLPTVTDALQAGGWVWRGVVPWHKPTARPIAGRFTNACEYVVWGSRGPLPLDWTADVLPGFYQYSPPRSQDRDHITQKPLALMRDMMRIVPAGGLVVDPFVGSGTTGAAAVLEGRRFLGVEIDPAQFAIADTRIRTAAGSYREPAEQRALVEP